MFLLVLALAGFATVSLWQPVWWQRLVYPLEYESHIAKYSRVNRLDPYTVAAVIYVESGFNPRSTSSAGARGLMQLLPGTAAWAAETLGDSNFHADQLDDPRTNIRYGTWYLHKLLERYDSAAFALAAYNGGGGNMDRWLKGKETKTEHDVIADIPFRETRDFVARVERTEAIYRRLYPNAFK